MKLGTVLVTGVSGFIASAVADRFSTAGWNVVGLTRWGTRDPGRVSSRVEVVRVPTYGDAELERVFATCRPDVVVNGAAYGVAGEDCDPREMFDANVALPQRLVRAADAHRPRLVVHLGSCFEYKPRRSDEPIREDWPLEPRSVYGSSKAAGSLYAAALAERMELPFVCLRLFGVYGPGEAPQRLLPYVISRLLSGRRVPLTSGTQRRDLLHVEDVARACVAAADPASTARSDTFNVCSGRARTIRSVVETAARLLGRDDGLLEFGALPQRAQESAIIVGDPTRFQSAFGWEPRITLEDGIRSMIPGGGEREASAA